MQFSPTSLDSSYSLHEANLYILFNAKLYEQDYNFSTGSNKKMTN